MTVIHLHDNDSNCIEVWFKEAAVMIRIEKAPATEPAVSASSTIGNKQEACQHNGSAKKNSSAV